jgi:hypothetical protein
MYQYSHGAEIVGIDINKRIDGAQTLKKIRLMIRGQLARPRRDFRRHSG